MNRILENLLKNKTVIFENLKKYGFVKNENYFIYKKNICDDQMELSVLIDEKGEIETKVYDLTEGDLYTLFLVENAMGSFVGKVKQEYEDAINDIIDKCYKNEVFKSKISKQVIGYVKTKYNRQLEFLWENFSENAIWGREDNNKWFGVMLKVPKRKLGLDSDELIEIIDLRMEENLIEKIVDNQKYFRGYHMNKKHWITICLDSSVDFNEICTRIDESYNLAKKK